MTKACPCPDTYPDWHMQDIDLSRHCVNVFSIPMLFHMPLAYDLYLRRQQEEVTQLELPERWPGFVLTSTGMLRGKIVRLLNETQSPSRHMGYLIRNFNSYAMLHQGGMGTIRKTIGEMQMSLVDRGRRPKELYLSYLTCPICEEEKGEKILLLRRWVESPGLKRHLK